MTANRGGDGPSGFAAESVKSSPGDPSFSSPDHMEQGDRTQSNRSLTGKDQPEAGTVDPDRPKPEDRYRGSV